MLNQNDFKEKYQGIKGSVQNFIHRFYKSDPEVTSQADGVVEPPLSDGSKDSEKKLVWDDDKEIRQ